MMFNELFYAVELSRSTFCQSRIEPDFVCHPHRLVISCSKLSLLPREVRGKQCIRQERNL